MNSLESSLPSTLPSTLVSAVESTASETMAAVSTPSAVATGAEILPLNHPENPRDVSEQKTEKHVVFSHESSSEEIDSAEGELDDEADEDEDEDALISTASFQNGDEVIISSASSAYNGERARIVDIRGDKLMLSVKDEQVVLTLDEVKSLNERTQEKNQRNKNVRTSARIRHQTQPMSPYHNQADKQSSVRRNDRPKRDAAGNTFGNPKSGAAPRSRNNSKAMLGKRVAIVGGRNKGERGRVTKGANGYFTIVLERSSTNPSSNTQVMKRSHDLKVIDGSGDFPIPHRRANQNGWNKKNKSRAYDDTEDEMDEEKPYDDDLSDEEEYDSRSTKRTGWAARSRSHSPSFSSNSEMESEPLSESESSLIQSDDESESATRHSVKSKPVANIEREAAQILMDILQARANPQLKRQYADKAQSEPQMKRPRTFNYDEANQNHDTNSSNQAMITEDYARVDAESRPNLNVVIGQEDHQFYTPLLSSTSTVASHHASPAIAPVVDESKLYPSSPFATLSAPLQLTSAQNSPSMKSLNAAAAANASLLYQKAVTTPTHGVRTQFFPPTPRSPITKAVILPATPNGSCTPQAFSRVSTTPVFQSFPSPMPAAHAVRASPTNLAFTISRPQMTILSTAASTVL